MEERCELLRRTRTSKYQITRNSSESALNDIRDEWSQYEAGDRRLSRVVVATVQFVPSDHVTALGGRSLRDSGLPRSVSRVELCCSIGCKPICEPTAKWLCKWFERSINYAKCALDRFVVVHSMHSNAVGVAVSTSAS